MSVAAITTVPGAACTLGVGGSSKQHERTGVTAGALSGQLAGIVTGLVIGAGSSVRPIHGSDEAIVSGG